LLKSEFIREVKIDRFKRNLNDFLFTIDDDSIVNINFDITSANGLAFIYTALIIYKEDTK